jgi:hypothetical protein
MKVSLTPKARDCDHPVPTGAEIDELVRSYAVRIDGS